MKKMKDLYDLYVESIKNDEMPIFERGEKKYIRVWTEMQPIREYYIILDEERAKYYEVKKYADKEILGLVAVYRSMAMAIYMAERYDYCRCIEVEEYDYYKDAERLERIIEVE